MRVKASAGSGARTRDLRMSQTFEGAVALIILPVRLPYESDAPPTTPPRL